MRFRKKSTTSESLSVDELLEMNDKQIQEAIRSGQVPNRAATDLRKEAKVLKRASSGETGVSALWAAAKGGGTGNRNHYNLPLDQRQHPGVRGGGGTGNRNHQNIPLKDRVHPAEYQRILDREGRRQGLL